jgi:thiosulfate/3-mercaptopyruvate sulfurtransferase
MLLRMKNLISPHELAHLQNPVILDARFRLQDPSAAERLYREGHIPGAQRVDLDQDLSGPKNGRNGRHPLPSRAALSDLFSRLGIGPEAWVITYDDTDHAGSARLWFLLRWMGHEKVKVLNGGWKAWMEAGFSAELGEARSRAPAAYRETVPLVELRPWEEAIQLVDARAPERYRGEVEPLDAKAGHIPGAKNLPYGTVLEAGRFPPASVLRERLGFAGQRPTFYCGSGVTACVLLLAAEEAGLDASLYPGSWSEYSSLVGARVATGA